MTLSMGSPVREADSWGLRLVYFGLQKSKSGPALCPVINQFQALYTIRGGAMFDLTSQQCQPIQSVERDGRSSNLPFWVGGCPYVTNDPSGALVVWLHWSKDGEPDYGEQEGTPRG